MKFPFMQFTDRFKEAEPYVQLLNEIKIIISEINYEY